MQKTDYPILGSEYLDRNGDNQHHDICIYTFRYLSEAANKLYTTNPSLSF